jgi:hypothetical protein
MYQGTGYPNNLPQYFSTITQNYTATSQAASGNNPSTLYLGDFVQTTQSSAKLFSVCPYGWLSIILPHTRCCCVWPISGLPIQVYGVIKPQICSPKYVHSHLLIFTNADQLKLVHNHYRIQSWINHNPFSGTTKSPTHPVAQKGLPDIQNP